MADPVRAAARPDFAVPWASMVARPSTAGQLRAADPASLQQLAGRSMGTTWSLRFDNVAMLALDLIRTAVQDALDRVVAQMSHWDRSSVLSRFNRAAEGESLSIPQEFAEVLSASLAWARASDGAFDPTVGPVVGAWGFGPDAENPTSTSWSPPSEAVVQQAAASTGWRRIDFDEKARLLRQPGELTLDFSGIAKGFAVDQAVDALVGLGLRDLLIEVGGELRALGRRPGGAPWRAGIAVPAELDSQLAMPPLALTDLAVASSGDGWHRHEHAGRRYPHTIDPRSAAPVAHELAQVTVLHRSCMDADALATVLTVLGPEAGAAFATTNDVAALFIEHRRSGPSVHASPAWVRLTAPAAMPGPAFASPAA